MKINVAKPNASQIAANNTSTKKAVSSEKADNKNLSAAELGSSSKVNVSENAQRMQKAKEVASTDTVNEARVAELQKMIDSGSYKVDASAIADRMVDEHIMMGE